MNENEKALKALEEAIKAVVPNNSICLIQVSDDKLDNVLESIAHLNKMFMPIFNIAFVASPDWAKITVIPAGNQVKINTPENES